MATRASRMYRIDEIPSTFDIEGVFIEYRHKPENNRWAFYQYKNKPFLVFSTATSAINCYVPDYGITWRCWDSRPDPEESAKEAWLDA